MDFEFPRGDTFIFQFRLKDKEGNLITLGVNDKLYMTCKDSPSSGSILFQKKLGSGIEKVDDYYRVTIEPDDTTNLNYTTYGFDIELKTGAGIVTTLKVGSITLTDEYTFKGDEN